VNERPDSRNAGKAAEKKSLRVRLEGLAVYVKVIAGVVLSAMAVYLSYKANEISTAQLAAAEREVAVIVREQAISEGQRLPRIEVVVTRKSVAAQPLLEVWIRNLGGSPIQGKATSRWFLALVKDDAGYLYGRPTLLVSVPGFGGFAPPDGLSLTLGQAAGVRGLLRAEILWVASEGSASMSLFEVATDMRRHGLYACVCTLVTVSYTDISGSEHVEYFKCALSGIVPVWVAQRIEDPGSSNLAGIFGFNSEAAVVQYRETQSDRCDLATERLLELWETHVEPLS